MTPLNDSSLADGRRLALHVLLTCGISTPLLSLAIDGGVDAPAAACAVLAAWPARSSSPRGVIFSDCAAAGRPSVRRPPALGSSAVTARPPAGPIVSRSEVDCSHVQLYY